MPVYHVCNDGFFLLQLYKTALNTCLPISLLRYVSKKASTSTPTGTVATPD